MSRTATPTSTRWELWSSYAFLATDEPRHLAGAEAVARRVLAEVDRACSRFREDSDLSRANAGPGGGSASTRCWSPRPGWRSRRPGQRGGLVDPCLGRRLAALGYDADLAVLRRRGPPDLAAEHGARVPRSAWREVRVDRRRDPGPAAAPPSTSAPPARPGPPTWWPRASSTSSAAGVVVSLGGDLRVDGPDEASAVPAPWPSR